MRSNRFIVLLLTIILAININAQSIHSLSFLDINGTTIQMGSYSGKKVLLIIAPSTLSDSLKIFEIKSFQDRYNDSVVIIGIMSIENGFNTSNGNTIKGFYQQKGINIILTSGMHTKKSSGSNQSALMKWLTTKSLNSKFDIDAMGVMQKYFVNESGKLYGVISPKTSLMDANVSWAMYRDN